MDIQNTLLNRPELDKGTKFSEKRLLEYAIVLNGLILDFQVLKTAGAKGLLFIVLQMGLTIFVTYHLGKALGFNKKFSLLMGAGNAVCGSSAIGTVAPILKADEKEKGISITIVNVTGTFLMVLLPLLSALLYKRETIHTSALIGGTVQSIGQVIALATVFKLMRVLLLAGVALVYGRMNTVDGVPLFSRSAGAKTSEKAKLSVGVPWFICPVPYQESSASCRNPSWPVRKQSARSSKSPPWPQSACASNSPTSSRKDRKPCCTVC